MSVNSELSALLTKMGGTPTEQDSNNVLLSKITDILGGEATEKDSNSELIGKIAKIYSGSGNTDIEYECGVFEITERLTDNTIIPFEKTHSDSPVIFCLAKVDNGLTFREYSNGPHVSCGCLFTRLLNLDPLESKSSSPYHQDGISVRAERSTSYQPNSLMLSGGGTYTDGATKWEGTNGMVTSSGIVINSSLGYSVGQYRWFALWFPTLFIQ